MMAISYKRNCGEKLSKISFLRTEQLEICRELVLFETEKSDIFDSVLAWKMVSLRTINDCVLRKFKKDCPKPKFLFVIPTKERAFMTIVDAKSKKLKHFTKYSYTRFEIKLDPINVKFVICCNVKPLKIWLLLIIIFCKNTVETLFSCKISVVDRFKYSK